RKRHYEEDPQRRRELVADRLCELGRYGQKTGKGWYRYEGGDRTAHADAEDERIIAAQRQAVGITPRQIGNIQLDPRQAYALFNEGARIVDEGIALRASDIDMIYLNGYGFLLHRGGPMLYADMTGLAKVAQRMHDFAGQSGGDAAFWQPAPLLARLAADGK